MISASGRYVITFNGEVYNFTGLSAILESLGHRFRGHSDTEVVLAAFEQWGILPALRRFHGMFAFALWDRQERVLHLARDRMGEKPLYYGWLGNALVFGSELRALRRHPDWHGKTNPQGIAGLLRYGYVPTPLSIHAGVYKLPPATLLSLPFKVTTEPSAVSPIPQADDRKQVAPRRYWSLKEAAEQGLRNPINEPVAALRAIEQQLHISIRRQMISDVSLGAFLSGGIDSSTVVAIMQHLSEVPVKTFTIGFQEKDFNEAEHAMAIARHLGTEHTELYVTADDALAVVPELTNMYDEPFADPSQIPTFLLSKMAKQQVTVALSGDGGDELFAGYNRYFWTDRIWNRMGRIPAGLRRPLGRALQAIPPQTWTHTLQGFEKHVLRRTHPMPSSGHKLHKLADLFQENNATDIYKRLLSYWDEPGSVLIDTEEPPSHVGAPDTALPAGSTFIDQAMLWDQSSYLVDDNLTKVDRASMSVSLETRLPFLDHAMVELAWRIPLELRIRDRKTKWPLRQVLYRYVPEGLVERPKMGFSVPVGSWLRGPLREWAESLMATEAADPRCPLNMKAVRRRWQQHLAGVRDNSLALWAILMLLGWAHNGGGASN
jgi:asparagine synthase (glutamine-hydrolysing)